MQNKLIDWIKQKSKNSEYISTSELINEFPELFEVDYDKLRNELIGGLMWQRDNLKSVGPHDNNLILPGFTMSVGVLINSLEKTSEPTHKYYSYDDKLKAYSDGQKEVINNPEKYGLQKFTRQHDNNEIYRKGVKAGIEIANCNEQRERILGWSDDYDEDKLCIRFAFYTYKDEDDILYLSNLFVEEFSRNKGFGSKILKSAERVAKILGLSLIRLKVKQGTSTHKWYLKHGYKYLISENEYDWLEKKLDQDSYEINKTYLADALWCVEQASKIAKDENELGTCWFAKRFLEALTPPNYCESCQLKKSTQSWKPNKEQLDALKKAADEHWEPDGIDPLYTLYQELLELSKNE